MKSLGISNSVHSWSNLKCNLKLGSNSFKSQYLFWAESNRVILLSNLYPYRIDILLEMYVMVHEVQFLSLVANALYTIAMSLSAGSSFPTKEATRWFSSLQVMQVICFTCWLWPMSYMSLLLNSLFDHNFNCRKS